MRFFFSDIAGSDYGSRYSGQTGNRLIFAGLNVHMLGHTNPTPIGGVPQGAYVCLVTPQTDLHALFRHRPLD